ncbi:mannitol dehydrogenase family protein [Microbacterium sp. 5K110]|uniref:mannitol dehydrogenase family protein n=1 Tax=unclassified Microbacterium TaxID=2609290 RepID=UPI0010FE2E80|nr:mannitol dehydrogenase family protein [Microbacterium sp. 5K110]TLF31055.1 mannitol dehydrogenase family protein [Microbacterium sp. 5K110]
MTEIAHILDGSYTGTAQLPAYNRDNLATGIVHLGVGNFHRSHQAYYLDQLLHDGQSDEWAICGVGVLPSDEHMRNTFHTQTGLYTLLQKSPDGTIDARVIGSMPEYLWVPDDADTLREKLAGPSTRIVTLTVTEGGYNIDPATGSFRTHNPAVLADAAGEGTPRTHFRILHESLKLRRDRGLPAYTVASCDNILGNGHVTKRTLLEYLALADPDFIPWVENNVAFPNSMVDRITPVTSDEDRTLTASDYGIDDKWPVPAESFIQWVLEDTFPLGRPALEKVGVQLVDDVIPYEMMKMRLLNASHQVIGTFGALIGYHYVHEAMADPLIHAAVAQFQQFEAEPTLPPVPGVDLPEYRATLLERFSNPGVKDTIARLSSNTSNSAPNFIVPIIRDQRRQGGQFTIQAALIAAWAERAALIPVVIEDPRKDFIHSLATDKDPSAFVRDDELFAELAIDQTFIDEFVRWRRVIASKGIRAALELLLTS